MTLKKIPFPFPSECSAFMQSLGEAVQDSVRIATEKYMSHENMRTFHHGVEWQSHNSSSPNEVSTLSKHSHSIDFPIDDVINNRATLIDKKVKDLSGAMVSAFENQIMSVMSQSCEKIGNTIVTAGKSPAVIWLETLELIELSVSRDGTVTLPTSFGNAIEIACANDPLSADPYYQSKLAEVIDRKTRKAFAYEADRVSRFKVNHE